MLIPQATLVSNGISQNKHYSLCNLRNRKRERVKVEVFFLEISSLSNPRIEARVREDEEGSKLITACKEFFVWPTSKVASQRKEDDEYVAKNDKSVTFDYKEDDINKYIENNKNKFEEKIKRLEENKIKLLKMQEIDNKVLNVTGPPFSTYVKKIIDIINFNPEKEQMVKSKIISTGEVEYMKFNNYLEAVQYVRWHYDSKTDYDELHDHTKWIITDIGTNTVINRDFFYDERNKDTPDAPDTPDTRLPLA